MKKEDNRFCSYELSHFTTDALATILVTCVFFSCATNGPSITQKGNIPLGEAIEYLDRQPFENKGFKFEPIDDLSKVFQQLGNPKRTIKKDIPNKFESGVVDKGITLEYDSFVIQYYFASLKKVYFPYSIEFLSNDKVDRRCGLIGLRLNEFMSRIYPRKPEATREGQITFLLKNGADQINILVDKNEKIARVRIDYYLD